MCNDPDRKAHEIFQSLARDTCPVGVYLPRTIENENVLQDPCAHSACKHFMFYLNMDIGSVLRCLSCDGYDHFGMHFELAEGMKL